MENRAFPIHFNTFLAIFLTSQFGGTLLLIVPQPYR